MINDIIPDGWRLYQADFKSIDSGSIVLNCMDNNAPHKRNLVMGFGNTIESAIEDAKNFISTLENQ